jgi:excisionase family DNA binding protein
MSACGVLLACAESVVAPYRMVRLVLLSVDDAGYLTLPEIAAVLRCSERSVRRAIEDGRLPAVRVGPRITRVAHDDLQVFIGKAAKPTAGGV